MTKTFAVITGASSGLGMYMAQELALRGINTILISMPGEGLKGISEKLRLLGTESYYYETDLTEKENVVALASHINANYNVNILINNAGIGGTESFINSDINYINRIMQLNIVALSLFTHQLLPNLIRQNHSYILNVSSMASFSPIGFKTVYPASKKFVQHFSRGLYQELKDTNVFVSVVHPGPMKTNHSITSRIEKQGLLGKLGLLEPEKVAKVAIRQLFKHDSLILVGISNQFIWLFMTIVPIWIKLPLLTKAVKRELYFNQNVQNDTGYRG